MTAREYIDEVKLRLSRADVVENLNDIHILTLINQGRKQAQIFSMDIVPHRYGRISRIVPSTINVLYSISSNTYGVPLNVYRANLPIDFINEHKVILNYTFNSTPQSFECRYTTMKEFYSIGMHSFNLPSIIAPIYTVQYSNGWALLIAGLDLSSGGSILTDINYTNISIDIWHTVAIKSLEFRNAAGGEEFELALSPDIEELAILYAMVNVIKEYNIKYSMQTLTTEIEMAENLITQNYEISKTNEEALATYNRV